MVTCDAEQRTEHDDMLPLLLTDSEGQTDLHSKHEVYVFEEYMYV